MSQVKAPRGTQDVYPPISDLLTEVEAHARALFERYAYQRIDTPIFEHTEAFVRSVGASSDIVVQKQMYTFTDRSGRELALRPDGTFPVARAVVEHKLYASLPQPLRLWYLGPFFRYERPQKGRSRQFLQAGVETFGSASPVIDAEVMALAADFYRGLGLAPELLLNSMGCLADRQRYGPLLRDMLAPRIDELCEDCRQRLERNPMRVFDCKVEGCRAALRGVDPIFNHLCPECLEHFTAVRAILDAVGVKYTHDLGLVRGFDYYRRTVFEFHVGSLGPRSSVGGGGRYDDLVSDIGGPAVPGIGMAIGIEPVLLAVLETREAVAKAPDVFVAWTQDLAPEAMRIAGELRATGLRVLVSDEGKSIKAQLRAADRSGSARAVILHPNDVERGMAVVRDLAAAEQRELPLGDVAKAISESA